MTHLLTTAHIALAACLGAWMVACATEPTAPVIGEVSGAEGDAAWSGDRAFVPDDGALVGAEATPRGSAVAAQATRSDAQLVEPIGYDASRAYPLIVLLHYYQGSAVENAWYFHVLQLQLVTRDFLLLLPDGTVDEEGNRFWEATDTCCDHDGREPGDVEWLVGQIERVRADHDVSRVALFGASNGGFMAHAMACQASEHIDAIASFAGVTYEDASLCAPAQPVSVLQIHGEDDDVVYYDGLYGETGPAPLTGGYPSAGETVSRWLEPNGCEGEPTELPRLDLDTTADDDETVPLAWSCSEAEVELWTMGGVGHAPDVDTAFAAKVVDRLSRY